MEFFAVVVLSLSLVTSANANEFLTSRGRAEYISGNEIRASLLSEIESSLPNPQGSRLTASSFSEIEDSLRPIYESLPKNAFGRLAHVVARYALHRFFVLRHGWVIQGLQPTGGVYNASSPAGILKDQVPSYIVDLFEQRIGGKGFNLHELAVLAATVTHLIQEETAQRLAAAFNIHDTLHTGTLNHLEAEQMLDTYIMSYILSENLEHATLDSVQKQVSEMPVSFNHWGEAQEFVRTVKEGVMRTTRGEERTVVDNVDFGALVKVASVAGEQFGEFLHSKVCKGLKKSLMDLEYRDTGRVKLSAFYKPALNGYWQFQESAGYLRELGVLEETDPKDPSVMIANYLVAPANCIASSGFYSVCCRNECEGLLGHLEQTIAAPEATPGAIAALIKHLPSDTVPAPRALSANLLRRLEEIAASHAGMVPLHGRLFSQWMHHAYPRECPYPHISGTTSPQSPEEWLETSGAEVEASEEEMLQYIQWSRNVSATDMAVEDLMTWSPEEELLVIQSTKETFAGWPQSPAKTPVDKRSIALFAVAGSLAYALIQGMKATSFASQAMPQKFVI